MKPMTVIRVITRSAPALSANTCCHRTIGEGHDEKQAQRTVAPSSSVTSAKRELRERILPATS